MSATPPPEPRSDRGGGEVVTAHFPRRRVAVRDARHWLRNMLDPVDGVDGESRRMAELLVTELAANAVVHAASDFEVAVTVTNRRVRVEVADWSDEIPKVLLFAPWATAGRGLAIVHALSDRAGADDTPHGKVMWFELDLRTPRDARWKVNGH